MLSERDQMYLNLSLFQGIDNVDLKEVQAAVQAGANPGYHFSELTNFPIDLELMENYPGVRDWVDSTPIDFAFNRLAQGDLTSTEAMTMANIISSLEEMTQKKQVTQTGGFSISQALRAIRHTF